MTKSLETHLEQALHHDNDPGGPSPLEEQDHSQLSTQHLTGDLPCADLPRAHVPRPARLPKGLGGADSRPRARPSRATAVEKEEGQPEHLPAVLSAVHSATQPAPSEGWRQHWYPLALGEDLGTDTVVPVAVHSLRLALFRDGTGQARAVLDRCPHRAARLSDGVLREGRLECLYHGWQFGGDGRCTHIPQWPDDRPIPGQATVESFPTHEVQGMVWVWPGQTETADPTTIPTIPGLEVDDCTSIDFAIDLPYEQTFLIENVIDIAHIHVAHDGVRGGGHRHLAAPLDFDIGQRTAEGFEGAFRSVGAEQAGAAALRGARVLFRAPGLVHYESLYEDSELVSGLALYSLPQGPHQCRLIYRAYSNFWPTRARLRPRWFEHWTQCTILEQDMDVVVGQAAEMHRTGRSPKELWLPLKSSDGFVLAYRRWLDEFAADWPYAVGFARVDPATTDKPPTFDRYSMHTQLCSACQRADALCQASRGPLALGVVGCLAVAAATAGSPLAWAAAGLAVTAALARGVVDHMARQFR